MHAVTDTSHLYEVEGDYDYVPLPVPSSPLDDATPAPLTSA
jgi:hypothetical protein